MVSTNDFKTGMTIQKDGKIFSIIEFMHVKPGKGGAFVWTKLRNLRTGAIIEFTFNAGVKVETAMIDKVEMQFIYADGDNYVFMNNDTYEQVEIPGDRIENEKRFLVEGLNVNVQFFKNNGSDEFLGVILPDKVSLTIVDTTPGVKNDNTKTNSMKDATLETGYVIKVPMFIESGEKIIVSTLTGEYSSRDNK